jgi:hypothetical protein
MTALDALLSDPDPAARLIAADLAAEQGLELLESVLRGQSPILQLWNALVREDFPRVGQSIPSWRCRVGVYEMRATYPTPNTGFCLIHPRNKDMSRYCWSPSQGWMRFSNRRERGVICHYLPPPPVLEAAVLTVLRRRLAEIS